MLGLECGRQRSIEHQVGVRHPNRLNQEQDAVGKHDPLVLRIHQEEHSTDSQENQPGNDAYGELQLKVLSFLLLLIRLIHDRL